MTKEDLYLKWTVDQLVCLAKRENNSRRPYLYVNPFQGKHMPTHPTDVIEMCRGMADLIDCTYSKGRLYVIGFAETATGIAASTSSYLHNIIL